MNPPQTPNPNTPSRHEHHKIPHYGRSLETYSSFPALRPEHAGLVLEVLCLSVLGIADAVAAVMESFGVLLVCCSCCCALPYCIPGTQYHCCMGIAACCCCCGLLWRITVLLYCSSCCAVYPGTVFVVETTSTNAVYEVHIWYDVPGTTIHIVVVALLLCLYLVRRTYAY